MGKIDTLIDHTFNDGVSRKHLLLKRQFLRSLTRFSFAQLSHPLQGLLHADTCGLKSCRKSNTPNYTEFACVQ